MSLVRWIYLSLGLALGAAVQAQAPAFKVLIFSATAGYRHPSIPNGIATIQMLGASNHFAVDATEDATRFNDANLAKYQAIIFLNTTGDVLTNAPQQAALQHYIQSGGGWVGIHAAADTHHTWGWYGGLAGAYFVSHPNIQQATVKVADRVDPSSSMLPKRWIRTDEWYNFARNPRSTVHVLATLDETTYTGGANGPDHPIAWNHVYDGGRAWYTAGGHTPESYAEPLFQAHLLGGIQFAAGVKRAEPGATSDANFQKVILDGTVSDPLELAVAPDGRVFYIERGGNLKSYQPRTSLITIAGHLNVEEQIEDGLLGLALDPGFATNNWIYLFYSPAGAVSEQRISRFTLVSEILDLSSEKILLRVPTQRLECCHSAGGLFMHTNGDLYVSVGDNTNPFSSDGFAPLDQRPGRSAWDSQKSASNENDLRGKILRLHPLADGTYAIPNGNLFPPGTPLTKPEIYIMGCRNPFRLSVDEATGWVYWGEVGPDAGSDVASRGPKGYDEWNQARAAGNFGWPYFIANNKPYVAYDFATGISGASFDPNAPSNNSPNNTGPVPLPAAQPAWLWYPYDPSVEFPELNGSGGRTAMGGPVYHFKTNVLTATKLPAYYDNTLLIWEWSRNYLKEVKIDDDGSALKINPFLPSFSFNRPIDLKIGLDGVIYMIEWGTGFNGSNPDAKLVRIDYVGGHHAPVAIASASPASGPVPLSVQFSSAGTYAPDPNDLLTIRWSFFGDATINSTLPNPTFNYTNAGNYQAQLIVTDSQGSQTIADVPISAGNSKPIITISQPPDGAIFDWGKALAYQLSVVDAEDGSTASGTIACSNVFAAPLLGHNDHSHAQGVFAGCAGVFTAPINTDSDADNLFLALNASYTDNGAPGVAPLLGRTTYIFNPRHKQAEFCTTNSGVTTAPTADPSGGGLDVADIRHGSYIALSPVNLTNINAIIWRLASLGLGGRIETHVDSPEGPLISTATVPYTAGAYTNITAPVADPGGTHMLYFVFLRNPGDVNLFVLNWFEFQGPGLSLDSTPLSGTPGIFPGTIQAEDFDEGGEGVAYHDSDAANLGGQYRNTGVDIKSTTDTGAGYNITAAIAGEWLKYTVNIRSAGLYTLSARVASQGNGGAFHLEFAGVDKTGTIFIPDTGGWQSWRTLSISNVLLDAGTQVIRLIMDANGSSGWVGNFNYLRATLVQANNPPTVALTAPADRGTFSAPATLTLRATAFDTDGTIKRVDFFSSGFAIGTATNSPYSITWSNVPAGNYLLTARATDNIGNSSFSNPRTIRVINGETPFAGFPQTVPGIVQAEDFDNGGPGVAYQDADVANSGGKYRNTAVDIEATTDVGGGFDVGYTTSGEWLKYTINAAVDGLYRLQIRVASAGDGGAFHVEFDGVDKTGRITNSNTGGWQTWRTLSKDNVGISAGLHVMRLVLDSRGSNGSVGNFNYFVLTATSSNPPPVLLHRYSFSEGIGAGTVADSVGSANGDVLGGAKFTGDGRLNLLGTNGYVDLPNGLVSGLTNATFEAWVSWNGGAPRQPIFDFGNDNNGENKQGTGLTYLMLSPESDSGVTRFAISTNAGSFEGAVTASSPMPVDQPTHIAISYDAVAGAATLYVNGQRVGTGPVSIPLSAIHDINNWLGRSQWLLDPYFSGFFDEFRIYDGVLSDAAVAASFAGGPDALFGPPPRLGAAFSPGNLRLTWTPGAPEFTLEKANSLLPGEAWHSVTNSPVTLNGEQTVDLPSPLANQFFRLRK